MIGNNAMPDMEELILSKVKLYNHHPVPNQLFLDILPIFRSPPLTEGIVDHLTSHILSNHEPSRISSIVCLEARGFFLGPLLASRLSLPCIPIRKRGKLPGEIISTSYEKDYGPDAFEIKTDSFEGIDTAGKGIILVDDLLATGGSVKAAKELLEKLGMEVLEAVFVFDIDVGNYNSEVEGKLGGLKRHAMITLTEKNIGTPVN